MHDSMLCILEHGRRLVILLEIIMSWTDDLSRNGLAYGSRIAAASFPPQRGLQDTQDICSNLG
jgi:hypothetical protein